MLANTNACPHKPNTPTHAHTHPYMPLHAHTCPSPLKKFFTTFYGFVDYFFAAFAAAFYTTFNGFVYYFYRFLNDFVYNFYSFLDDFVCNFYGFLDDFLWLCWQFFTAFWQQQCCPRKDFYTHTHLKKVIRLLYCARPIL